MRPERITAVFSDRLMVGVVCLLLAALAHAESSVVHTVEVIVFVHTHPPRFKSTAWPPAAQPAAADAVDLGRVSGSVDDGIYSLVSQSRKTREFLSALEASPDYDVAYHAAWRQPIYPGKWGKGVMIGPGWQTGGALAAGAQDIRIDGAMRLRRTEAIWLDIELRFVNKDGRVFSVLNESRPIKLDKYEYFDNPFCGVIARVFEVKEAIDD